MPFANSSLSPLETTAYSSSCKNQNRNLILKFVFCFSRSNCKQKHFCFEKANIFLNVTSSKHYYFGRYEIARVVLSALRKNLVVAQTLHVTFLQRILSFRRLLLDENLNDVFPRRRGAPPDVAQVRLLNKSFAVVVVVVVIVIVSSR